ncbi:MAG: hypothetical protein KDB02_10900 [Acidimicrobiales bacterium]|nr:hypothetical protein [Acidimicrobiales bacterium]
MVRTTDEVASFLDAFDDGELDEELAALARRRPMRRLRRRPRTKRATTVAGVEHEYRILDGDGLPVDARHLLPSLGIEGVHADPTDPNACRGRWGGVVTVDGAEIEVATPPVPIAPGFVDRIVQLTEVGRAEVERFLPPGFTLEGFSTHLNVSTPTRGDDRRAQSLARTLGPALMVLMDRPSSPGLLVRPRPGRMEFGAEYVAGGDLAAALAFAGAGCVIDRPARLELRRLAVRLDLVPAVERYGWYVDRRAAGVDLYGPSDDVILDRLYGSRVSVWDHLTEVWQVIRPALVSRSAPMDCRFADAVSSGDQLPPLRRLHRGTASRA